jgi:hypothetical protein
MHRPRVTRKPSRGVAYDGFHHPIFACLIDSYLNSTTQQIDMFWYLDPSYNCCALLGMTNHSDGWRSPESWLPNLPTTEDQGTQETAFFGCYPTDNFQCDERRPACLRCTNSDLICPGYPIRLKFMDEGLKFQGKTSQPQRSLMQSAPLNFPVSPSEKLSLELYQTFKPDLPRGKSLRSFTKTAFVTELPRYVGLSLASDLSMKALCLAHTTLLKSSGDSLVQSRIQYGRALAELQLCISNPQRAGITGTLCATMILGIFEVR